MLFSLAFFILLEVSHAVALVPRSSNTVCKSGIYAGLAPLASYAPAQAFCASKYPQTATVDAGKKRRTAPTTTTKATTKSTSQSTTKTTTKTTTKSTTKSTTQSTTKPTTPSTTKTTGTTKLSTTSSATCTKDKLECLWSSVAGEVAKTVSLSLVPVVTTCLASLPRFHPTLFQMLANVRNSSAYATGRRRQ
jgi:hypothetical protein